MTECFGEVTNPALYLLGAGVGVTIAAFGYPIMYWLGRMGWTPTGGFGKQEGA